VLVTDLAYSTLPLAPVLLPQQSRTKLCRWPYKLNSTGIQFTLLNEFEGIWLFPWMWTRPDVAEAKSIKPRQGQLSRGCGRGQNCINFSANFYILTPFSPKNEIFRRLSTWLEKFPLKMGHNMGTLLVNTPKWPATSLDACYCFWVYTLNRKCHILSVNITKHFNSTSKTTRPRGQAGWGRGDNCHEAEASFLGLEAEAGMRT